MDEMNHYTVPVGISISFNVFRAQGPDWSRLWFSGPIAALNFSLVKGLVRFDEKTRVGARLRKFVQAWVGE